MKRVVLFVPLLLVLVVGVILYAGIGKDPTVLESALIGKPLPAFSLARLDQPEQVLDNRALPQEPFLLNVWATWCPSCDVEHPYLVSLARQGVPIVGLNYKDNRDAALTWLEKKGDPYRFNLFDVAGRLGFELGVYGAPETYVIDAQGIVRYKHVGVVNEDVWRERLQPHLSAGGGS